MLGWYGLNRTMCDVLRELRELVKLSYGVTDRERNLLLSLVEEVQVYGNRMEAGLSDITDLESLHKEIKEQKNILKNLEAEVKDKE